jgi:hypothetical protein
MITQDEKNLFQLYYNDNLFRGYREYSSSIETLALMKIIIDFQKAREIIV